MKPVKRARCPVCGWNTNTDNGKLNAEGFAEKLTCKKDGSPMKLSKNWYVRDASGKMIMCGPTLKEVKAVVGKIAYDASPEGMQKKREEKEAEHKRIEEEANREPDITWEDAKKALKKYNKEHDKADETQVFYAKRLKSLDAAFGQYTMQQITRPMVTAYRTERMKEVGNRTVNAEMTALKRMYSVLMSEYSSRSYQNLHNAGNDIKTIEALPLPTKERNLTMKEIKTVWNNLNQVSEPVAKALKLILLTAQRPGEVAGINEGEIDGNWWTIPASRSKNGIANRVPLSDATLELTKDINISRTWLSQCLNRIEDNGKVLGVPAFTPHDLRRTVATQLSKMGVLDAIIDQILNHTKQGVIKFYNLNKYDAEKKEALTKWENKLMSFLAGKTGTVLEFKKPVVLQDETAMLKARIEELERQLSQSGESQFGYIQETI